MNPGDRPLSSVYAAKGKAAVPELLRLAPTARDAPSALPVAPSRRRRRSDRALRGHRREGRQRRERRTARSPTPRPRCSRIRSATTSSRPGSSTSRCSTFAASWARPTSRRTHRPPRRCSSARTPSASSAGASSRRTAASSFPIGRRTRSQSHADLSQLEAGDAVEAIYEGWGLPNETGNVGIDTPDLLPERTAVREATIELRVPAGPRRARSGATRCSARPRSAADAGQARPHLAREGPRRSAASSPASRRWTATSASASRRRPGTTSRAASARRSPRSRPRAPRSRNWAREAAGGKPVSRELVDKIVAASGQAVKEASGVDPRRRRPRTRRRPRHDRAQHPRDARGQPHLAHRAGASRARHQDRRRRRGERSVLRQRLVPAALRSLHASARDRARARSGEAGRDERRLDRRRRPGPAASCGPDLARAARPQRALPRRHASRRSPRVAGEAERDEIDIRLVVDEQGNAKGTITVLLRGHSAQDLAEALVRLVGLERQRALRGIALGWVPFATVEKVELSSSEGQLAGRDARGSHRAGLRAARRNEARDARVGAPGHGSGPVLWPVGFICRMFNKQCFFTHGQQIILFSIQRIYFTAF